ncbi:unnamed protein product [Rotaria magnacalcarata]|uniref:Uncharacterized protein n=1 Tax=Rotaria magnacalcarata TaxID=392030 RepID=A0A815G432_9BILA|nr:unnamed protein product [Rotaria magnacalcarata]CAF1655306.1 unnamed protein product [Rotaria magnacalcarata]CAF1932009.1 unnamed protein product [Rotaria magnacalcarata]CAF3780657.1 unnamed protein product [Rotaria magnacalcarata]CAF4117075.1 unnamed protein product [Rotaria magnacalcarata]
MESKRTRTRNMLQRVMTLTKHAYDFQSSVNLTAPLSMNSWHLSPGINLDQIQGLNTNPTYQNLQLTTCPLCPSRNFDFARAQKFLQLELDRQCASISNLIRYDPKNCLNFVQDLSQHLRRVLKSDTLNSMRYKIIVIATIVQAIPDGRRSQSIAIISRCLWDHETDESITAQATLGYDMLVVATVYAVYTD